MHRQVILFILRDPDQILVFKRKPLLIVENPVGGVSAEQIAFCTIVLFQSFHEPNIASLNQIREFYLASLRLEFIHPILENIMGIFVNQTLIVFNHIDLAKLKLLKLLKIIFVKIVHVIFQSFYGLLDIISIFNFNQNNILRCDFIFVVIGTKPPSHLLIHHHNFPKLLLKIILSG